MSRAIVLQPGDRFGRLEIVRRGDKSPGGVRKWVCKCDCGKGHHEVTAAKLTTTRKPTRSCGCLHREVSADTCRRTKTTHHMVGTPEFRAWCQLRNRCTNPEYWAFDRYGGRGITVCHLWLGPTGFAKFLEDMGPRPSPKHSVDRYPNNDGNYEKSNCRWATSTEQNNNRVNNRLVTHNGKTQSVAAWERELQLPTGSLQSRLQRGWTDHDAMTKPYRKVQFPGRNVRTKKEVGDEL